MIDQKNGSYDVFLSYSSLDRPLVGEVAQRLERRGCSYWFDQSYLKPGHDWVPALEQALSASKSMAVFLGPREMGRWQQRERAWALDRHANDERFSVIPVLLPDCEPPLDFLRLFTWIDLRSDPSDGQQVEALVAAIRGEHQDTKETRSSVCPYRGLMYFREEDAGFFFGRDKYIKALADKVQQHPIVAVVGASGSGKSSVVRAGLVPRLRRQTSPVWDIVTMVPGEKPLHALADVMLPLVEPELSGYDRLHKRNQVAKDLYDAETRLSDLVVEGLRQQPGTHRLLLVVDQWEELYTLCADDRERERFVSELLEATERKQSSLAVVITLRGDFYVELLQHRSLIDRLDQATLSLGPMTRDELRSAIEKPAQTVGLTFQGDLVDRLLDDARDEPGRLPLLEFALEELWKRHDRGQLTHAAYGDLGQLSGAIAARAETIFGELDEAEQAVTPALFRRLVRAGAKTEEDTRRRADFRSLDDTSQRVARQLADKRLLVTTREDILTGEPPEPAEDGKGGSANPSKRLSAADHAAAETVEVAHEELLRRWNRLCGWVNQDRTFLQWRARLGPMVEFYRRDPLSALLRPGALREAKQYYPARADEMEHEERAFVQASQAADRRSKRQMFAVIATVVALLIAAVPVTLNVRANNRVENLVARLLVANPLDLPAIVQQLGDYPRQAAPRLNAIIDAEASNAIERKRQLKARLALVRHDTSQVEPLRVALLDEEDPAYVQLICDHLAPHRRMIAKGLWTNFRDRSAEAEIRFRAGLALARFEPRSKRWTRDELRFLVTNLVASNPVHQPTYWALLADIGRRLADPLRNLFTDQARSETEQLAAANALARFAADDKRLLVDSLADATPGQYAILYPLLAGEDEQIDRLLLDVVKQTPGSELEPSQCVTLGRRRAAAAVALLRKGKPAQIFDLFRVSNDPESLTQFVAGCRGRGVTPELLLETLDQAHAMRRGVSVSERQTHDSVIYGLLLSLGEFDLDQMPPTSRQPLVDRLVTMYEHDPSSAVHGATGWLLRRWDYHKHVARVDHTPLAYDPSGERDWYVLRVEGVADAEGQRSAVYFTFVVFPPGEFLMGSPENEPGHAPDETLHRVKLTRPIAVSDREITWQQFGAAGLHLSDGVTHHDAWERYFGRELEPQDPAIGVSWEDAVSYCQRLAELVGGIPVTDRCYVAAADLADGDGQRMSSVQLNLEGSGFRLLTKAEWEYVCRSGTGTAYSFGNDSSQLPRYGWYVENSQDWSHRTAQLRPDHRGMFDLHGNLNEWCHDWFSARYQSSGEVVEDPVGPDRGSFRVIRGGSWLILARLCRSSYRNGFGPADRADGLGFRMAAVPSASQLSSGAESGGQPAPAEPDPGRAEPE